MSALETRRAEFLRLLRQDAEAERIRADERDIDASDYEYPAGMDREENADAE